MSLLCYISRQIIGSTLELILGMPTASFCSLHQVLGHVISLYAVSGDCIWARLWEYRNDMTAFRRCNKMTEQVVGAHVHRRACLLTFHKFLIDYGALSESDRMHALDTGELVAIIADPFFGRLLAEALFLPGIHLDRICITVQPRVGSRQGKTEDYDHFAGILFVRNTRIVTVGRLRNSFQGHYGLLGHSLR